MGLAKVYTIGGQQIVKLPEEYRINDDKVFINRAGDSIILMPISTAKEFSQSAGLSLGNSLNAEVVNGRIILTPQFRHRSLKERAADYGGQLNLSEELAREEPAGSEVW